MKEVIAVVNQKGGVGKSTTALALGAGLRLKGYKVLYVDLDAQENLTYALGADSTGLTALDLITGRTDPQKAIQQTEQGDIIPASPALAGSDTIITGVGKEFRLKEALEPIKHNYDYIIIDTPPALGILTIIAITASSGVIVPAQADIFSLQGISQLEKTLKAVKEHCNPDLKVKGILLTRHNPRAILSREVAEVIDKTARQLDTRLYKTTIRECIAIKEAQISQRDIFSYAPRSNASQDYTAFIEEMLKRR